MDKESKSASGGLSGNGIIAIVLLAAGVIFVREAPLEANRTPVSAQRLEQQTSTQDVDARLWQDPFSAVAQARAEAKRNAPPGYEEKRDTRLKALLEQIERITRPQSPGGSATPVQVLAVLLPSGPYSENVESRRRGRYAVLSALDASRLSPDDTEHIGYFFPGDEDAPAEKAAPLGKRPQPVAYEWFGPGDDQGRITDERRRPQWRVLVMWIQSEALGERPLAALTSLARRFNDLNLSWKVLGPNSSDDLKKMVDEVNGDFKAAPEHERMHIYSLNATAPDKALLPKNPTDGKDAKDLSSYFRFKGIQLIRTIGDDTSLADSLTDELVLRGLVAHKLPANERADDADAYRGLCRLDGSTERDRPSRVAVVGEWDTLYGRTLRREFRASPTSAGFCVERFSYVRGLDGVVPSGEDPAAKAGGSGAKAQAADAGDATRRKDGTYVERAEGQNQFDYLRRLSAQIRKQDEQARKLGGKDQGFAAIGVLGSDLHDKLLVLQALRPEFPDVIFFTTDMDARYLHPQVQPWTRNLVVASNFGLRLADGLQGGTPPFRDSYQTSAFLATRIAMDDARRESQPPGPATSLMVKDRIDRWLQRPRIFEIGRTEAFDFNGRELDADATAGGRCRGPDWRDACRDVHPWGSTRYPSTHPVILALIFAVLLAALWLPVWALSLIRTDADQPERATGKAAHAVWAALTTLMLIAVPIALALNWPDIADRLTRGGEPMSLGEGISIWPTEALRLLSLLLCLYLIVRGWRVLSRNLAQINHEFQSEPACESVVKSYLDADTKPSRRWKRMGQMFSTRFIAKVPPPPGEAALFGFWGRHIVQSRLSARLARTSACVILAAAATWVVMATVDTSTFVPGRGPLSGQVHDGLRWPALLMMYFLVFFVVDATVLCVRFVNSLRLFRGRASKAKAGQIDEDNWPRTTLEAFDRQIRVPRPYLDEWIDLHFVARRTRCVTALIYYPFIVISLWLLSRSATFDHWTWGFSNVFPAALGAAIAVACAVLLRRAAEASRTQALARIRDAIMRSSSAQPDEDAASIKQLEMLKTRIENLQEGAFAPFWQQPLLKAVLLPFATLGGTSILDAMKLANL